MVQVLGSGAYLVNGVEIIPDDEQAGVALKAKTGREISWDRFCHAGNVCIFYRRKSRVPYVLQKSREKTCKGTEKAFPL